ncbi:MAG TPA: hypothetical protein VNG71_09340 [Pyrinomonadaceae bacterium]|nr:hypothetical protein [Pyrinomonadaceae bacterium]
MTKAAPLDGTHASGVQHAGCMRTQQQIEEGRVRATFFLFAIS